MTDLIKYKFSFSFDILILWAEYYNKLCKNYQSKMGERNKIFYWQNIFAANFTLTIMHVLT